MEESYLRKEKVKISYASMLAIMVLLSCLDNIEVLNSALHIFHYFYIIRYVLIILLFMSYVVKRKRTTIITNLIVIFFVWIIAMTIRKQGDYMVAMQVISRPVLVVITLDFYRSKLKKVLMPWKNICLILVLLDVISMIIFPNGLYATDLYGINWFLGYKTARYEYVMPLVLISLYLSYGKREKIDFQTITICVISLFTMWYSQATAAFLSLALLIVVILLDNFKDLFKQSINIFYIIFSRKYIVILYILANLALFSIGQLPIVQSFVINVLHKDATLTTRTTLWEKIFMYISKSPMFGNGYLNFEQFVYITKNPYAGSAHNLMIRILISVGFLGLILFFTIISLGLPEKKEKKVLNKQYFTFLIGIVSTLIVGLTSDSLFLSFFYFSIVQLAFLQKKF